MLIAAKRQDGIAAALSQNDYDTHVAAKDGIETLRDINQSQLVMIQELQTILSRLDAGEGSAKKIQ
ncbi:MAG: hypothetical protein ABI053_05045 [Lacisediminihabitans sp.]